MSAHRQSLKSSQNLQVRHSLVESDRKRNEDTDRNVSNDSIEQERSDIGDSPMFSDSNVSTSGENQYAKNNLKRIKLGQLSEMVLTQIPDFLNRAKIQYTCRQDQWKRNKAIEFYSELKKWLEGVIRNELRVQEFEADVVQGWIDDFEKHMAALVAEEVKGNSSGIENAKILIDMFVRLTLRGDVN